MNRAQINFLKGIFMFLSVFYNQHPHLYTDKHSSHYDLCRGPFTVYIEVDLWLYTHIFVELMMLVPQTDKVIQANRKLSTKQKHYTQSTLHDERVW